MKKRKPDKGITQKLTPVECRGYRFGDSILYAEHHQQVVMVDNSHLEWPQCQACYREAYKVTMEKNFSTLKSMKKPKKIRDIRTVINYLDAIMCTTIGTEMHTHYGEVHKTACKTYSILMEKHYEGS